MTDYRLMHVERIAKCSRSILLDLTGIDEQTFYIFLNPSVKTCVLCVQNNHLIETVILSTQNICFC